MYKNILKITSVIVILCCLSSCMKPYDVKANNDAVSVAMSKDYTDIVPECVVKSYDFDVTLDTEKNVLKGSEIAVVKNNSDTSLSELCFRLYANSITGESTITAAENTKTNKEYAVTSKEGDGSVIYIGLNGDSLKPGKTISVKLDFSVTIPERKDRFGYNVCENGKIYNMTFCFPQISSRVNGVWNENPYTAASESTCNAMADYSVKFKAPEDYKIVASGKQKSKAGTTTITAKNIRELAVVACNFMEIETKKINGVRYNMCKPEYKLVSEAFMEDYYQIILDNTVAAVELYSEKVGDYIYNELDIVPVFFEEALGVGGMEMPGLVLNGLPAYNESDDALINEYSIETCIRIAVHEAAHEWFYCAVGNDQYNEPWLDESFASYLEEYYMSQSSEALDSVNEFCYEYYPESREVGFAVSGLFSENVDYNYDNTYYINFPLNEYKGDDYGAVYDSGRDFLFALSEAMGEKKFFKIMSDWYSDKSGSIATGGDFVDLILSNDPSEAAKDVINDFIGEDYM